jgi:hypothetical protein
MEARKNLVGGALMSDFRSGVVPPGASERDAHPALPEAVSAEQDAPGPMHFALTRNVEIPCQISNYKENSFKSEITYGISTKAHMLRCRQYLPVSV